ncbi:hypothetical protein GW17_00034422 [Ensete ventricosum]|nr:hypothetical protein GW17_00034422 [Ensete ventricosum]
MRRAITRQLLISPFQKKVLTDETPPTHLRPCALARPRSSRRRVGARSDGKSPGVQLGRSVASVVELRSDPGDLAEKVNSGTSLGDLAERVNSGTNPRDLAERVNSSTSPRDLGIWPRR